MDLEKQFAQERAEARSVPFTDLEVSNGGWAFEGLAAVYDQDADIGEFTESVNRGAYRKVIGRSDNVPMLYHHNGMLPVLATTAGGTLSLRDDAKGVRVKADIAQHYVGEAVRELVKRGDIKGMSSGFVVGAGNSRLEQRASKPHRTITDFKALLDVSPTWNPAYQGTTAEVRSLQGMLSGDGLSVLDESPAGRRVRAELRALTTGQYQNTLEGLQSIAEAVEAALNQVGFADIDEVADGDASTGPFTDQQYADALETIQNLVEAAEGLLEGAGLPDPDEGESAARSAADGAGDEPAAKPAEEQRAGVGSAQSEATARRRRLQMMGLSLPRGAR
jgi:HK97 family phage prohead protease